MKIWVDADACPAVIKDVLFKAAERAFAAQDTDTFQVSATVLDACSITANDLALAAAIDAAIRDGVSRVHVISYKLPDSILLEVFTNEGTGTLVVDDIGALSPEEQAAES